MKKLLLAFAILAYACMFYNRDQDGLEALASGTVQIEESVTLNSAPADMSLYGLDSSANFESVSLAESIRIFKENSSGIVFYAKPDSAECRIAAEVLQEAAQELNVKVYVVNTSDSVSTEDLSTLTTYIDSTLYVDQAGNKSFFVPDLIAVNNGVITGYHTSTVKGIAVSSNENIVLSDDQKKELKKYYLEVIHSITKTA